MNKLKKLITLLVLLTFQYSNHALAWTCNDFLRNEKNEPPKYIVTDHFILNALEKFIGRNIYGTILAGASEKISETLNAAQISSSTNTIDETLIGYGLEGFIDEVGSYWSNFNRLAANPRMQPLYIAMGSQKHGFLDELNLVPFVSLKGSHWRNSYRLLSNFGWPLRNMPGWGYSIQHKVYIFHFGIMPESGYETYVLVSESVVRALKNSPAAVAFMIEAGAPLDGIGVIAQ